jgi:hypothetical protein
MLNRRTSYWRFIEDRIFREGIISIIEKWWLYHKFYFMKFVRGLLIRGLGVISRINSLYLILFLDTAFFENVLLSLIFKFLLFLLIQSWFHKSFSKGSKFFRWFLRYFINLLHLPSNLLLFRFEEPWKCLTKWRNLFR